MTTKNDEEVDKTAEASAPEAEGGDTKRVRETVEYSIEEDTDTVASDGEVSTEDTSAVDGEGDEDAEGDDGAESESEDAQEEGDGEEGTQDTKTEDTSAKLDPKEVGFLKEFKPEAKAEWDKRFQKDGKLNIEAFSDLWVKGSKVGEDGQLDGSLPEGAYQYLESIGIPRDLAKNYEVSQKKEGQAITAKLFADAGGEETVKAAIEWAKKEGYSKEAKDRFNAAMKSRDLGQMQEALELVTARYAKANPKKGSADETPKTRVSPSKTPTASGTSQGPSGGIKPYADREEWSKANRALDRISDPAKQRKAHELHRARTRASKGL